MSPYRGKRALDLLVAGSAGVLFAPVLAAVAIAVWLEDGGPTLFWQPRIGRGRESFTILKFRTLRDSNVTRVGQWLRHSGIDELPQFVNVCRGQMSVVGPRPLTARDVARLGWSDAAHDWRFSAQPGITGLAQVNGCRGETSKLEEMEARVNYDLDYLRHWSPLLDIKILLLTVVKVFRDDKAY